MQSRQGVRRRHRCRQRTRELPPPLHFTSLTPSQIDEWGYEAIFRSNPKGKQEIRLRGKCIVYLIQGSFELGAELVDVDAHVVDREGFGYAIEGEELIRLRRQTAVVIIYVNWTGDKELLALGPERQQDNTGL